MRAHEAPGLHKPLSLCSVVHGRVGGAERRGTLGLGGRRLALLTEQAGHSPGQGPWALSPTEDTLFRESWHLIGGARWMQGKTRKRTAN